MGQPYRGGLTLYFIFVYFPLRPFRLSATRMLRKVLESKFLRAACLAIMTHYNSYSLFSFEASYHLDFSLSCLSLHLMSSILFISINPLLYIYVTQTVIFHSQPSQNIKPKTNRPTSSPPPQPPEPSKKDAAHSGQSDSRLY